MKKLLGLDGLRGMLALGVAFSHSYSHFTGWHTGYDIFHNPDYAVDIFFILSGIVLYYTYESRIKGKTVSSLDYIIVRFFRLYPLHIIAVALVPLSLFLSSGQFFPSWLGEITPFNVIGDITLTNSLGIGFIPKTNIPSWSISVEMFAGTLILLLACIHRVVPWILLVTGIAICLFLHIEVKGTSQATYPLLSEGVLRCWLCMSAGICSLQIVTRFNKQIIANQRFAKGFIATLFAIMMIVLFGMPLTLPYYVLLTLFISLAINMLPFIEFEVLDFFESRTMSELGELSFSIYIMHTPVVYLFLHFKSDSYTSNIFYATFAVLATIMISKLTFKYIELPMHKYGKRLVEKKHLIIPNAEITSPRAQ
ncbi:acyltransferase [Erwinia billingiae]|uniref:acyltransferase family protein n=1 Tax=Erwinia billingiae TaxID=182337 RepID=UPI00320B4155